MSGDILRTITNDTKITEKTRLRIKTSIYKFSLGIINPGTIEIPNIKRIQIKVTGKGCIPNLKYKNADRNKL